MGKICRDFQAGKCTFGGRCKFSHDLPRSSDGPSKQAGHNHPYLKPNKSTKFDRQSDTGHAQQQRGDRQPQQQQQHSGRTVLLPPTNRSDAELRQKGSGGPTPLAPAENYPLPPGEDSAAQQQQQQPALQRPQQQGIITPLDRARAMCKLLNISYAASLVTPEMQASALQFFSGGAFFRETPFADSVEKYLVPLKQQ